jgi:hypothetical protein
MFGVYKRKMKEFMVHNLPACVDIYAILSTPCQLNEHTLLLHFLLAVFCCRHHHTNVVVILLQFFIETYKIFFSNWTKELKAARQVTLPCPLNLHLLPTLMSCCDGINELDNSFISNTSDLYN